MMRLPPFRFLAPRTIDEAAAWLAESPADTMLLAGGTDLIPNMKRRQQRPQTVIGLRRIAALKAIDRDGGRSRSGRASPPKDAGQADRPLHDCEISIGAGVTLSRLVSDAQLRASCPGLWQAAAQIATPHLRNMGTVGGNLCLDTRCTYYDQTEDWRKAIGYCMKKDGETCWVATSSPKCLAVSSTDLAPMLVALGARVRLISAIGERTIDVADLYHNDGMHYLTRRPDEILADVSIDDQTGWRSAYWKLRRRGSFDFPVAAAAVAARFADDGTIIDARIVVGAVASRPMPAKASALIAGQRLTDDLIAAAADAAYDVAKPMDNTDYELVWRKKMIRTLVTAALREIRGDDMRELRVKLARQALSGGIGINVAE
jgi:4-hydroxybenzoyl-CoA reductase subunit beta